MIKQQQYYTTPGKLLITGEYLILEGAEGLALPLVFGQDMKVVIQDKPTLIWKALYPEGTWFTGEFELPSLKMLKASDAGFAQRLVDIVKDVRRLNPDFLSKPEGRMVTTKLGFNPDFGFGSSSTLIINLAKWAAVDAFKLQQLTFKGSGYDIACGLEGKPVIYKLSGKKPDYFPVDFNPAFAGNLFFVYQGKKQKSLDAITVFREKASFSSSEIEKITSITRDIVDTDSLKEFENLLSEHEAIMENILQIPAAGHQLFKWYQGGVVKSLGAWGGDFVMVTSKKDPQHFKKEMMMHGFNVVYGFNEIVFRNSTDY